MIALLKSIAFICHLSYTAFKWGFFEIYENYKWLEGRYYILFFSLPNNVKLPQSEWKINEYIFLIIIEEICPENKSLNSCISEPLKLTYEIFQLAGSIPCHLRR